MLNAFTTGEISFNLAKNNVGDTFRERYFYISHRDRLLLAVVEHSYELLLTTIHCYQLFPSTIVKHRRVLAIFFRIWLHDRLLPTIPINYYQLSPIVTSNCW